MPAFAVNGQRRVGSSLAIGLGVVAVLGAAANFIFDEIGDDWLRFSLVAQMIAVVALATVLARQIVALRRTQVSLVAANTDLAGAQASLETNNRILRGTQVELKRARQQLIDGIEGLSDSFALYDAEDRLVVCNSRYREMFGLDPDLLRPGTPFLDVLRAHVNAGRVAAAVGREDAWIAERLAQFRDPGGKFERSIDGHWFQYGDRPTSEGGTVTIFTQIDELKRREQRLRDSQAILQSVLDHIPVTVSITDRERRIVLLNRRIEDIYGVHQVEVAGRLIDEVRPRRYSGDSAARDHFRVIETGEPILGRADDYGRGRDAESWITNVAPIKGEDGSVRYVLRTTFEVPQLGKANRELADYRAFLIEAERQAKIASWHQTSEGGYRTIWSENVEAVTGYTSAQIHDDATFLAVVHPADRERIERLFRSVDDDPQSYDVEYRVVRADGRMIWVRGITKVDLDAAGDLVRYIGSIQDITETKRAEEALRESETLLKEAQRRARLAYWLWDPEAKRYSLAAEAAEILGLPVADLSTNDHFLPYVHEDDRAWVAEAFLGRTERLEPCVIEYRWRRPDGNVIWLRDMCEQEHDPSGRVRRLVGTMQDVTEQKRSEEALRENQALLLAAQRRARIAYWLEDIGPGQAYIASDFMAEVLGVSADAVPATDGDHVKLVHPEDRPRVAHTYERAVAAKTPYAIEYRVFRGDGSIGWLRELAEFQLGPGGKPVRIIGTIQDITEQKQAEEALRDSEARLRGFLDHAPFAMYVKDTNLRYLLVNRAVEEFQGMSAAEICGKTPDQIYPPELAQRFIAEDREVLAHGAPITYEYSDPKLASFADSLTFRFPIRDSHGRIVALGGITQDVSKRKRAERALQESEARLRAFLDHAPLLIYLKDRQERYVLVNREFERIEGRSAAEICGRTVHDILEPDVAERLSVDDREVLRTGAIVTREHRQSVRPPHYAEFSVVKFPIRDADGVITGVGTITQDISERKAAERTLRESEARLKDAQRRARLAYWSWDPAAREYAFGEEYREIVGVDSAEEVITDDQFLRFVHEADRDRVAASLQRQRDDLDPGILEYRVRRPDGRVVWLRDSCERELDAAGRVARLVGTVQDVTDQKTTEQALRESQARLADAQRRAKIAYWTWTGTGHGLDWHSDVAHVLGVQSDAMPETSDAYVRRLVHDADRAALAALYRRATEDPSPYETEYRIVKPDGSVAWIRELGEPVADGSSPPNYVGTLQDVTEQKQAELALRESEARLRAFMDHAPAIIYLKDSQGRYLMVNREFERVEGVTEDQVRGITLADLRPRDSRPALAEQDREVLDQGKVTMREISGYWEGGHRHLLVVKFPIRDVAGNIVGIGCYAQDISQHKQAELALAESEARFRSFMDNAPFDMVVKDLQGRYLMINRGVEAAWQLAATEILGRCLLDLSSSDGVAQVEAIEREVVETGHIVAREVHFTDLGPEWTYEVKFPIKDAAGGIVAIGGAAIDISDRKKAQMELAESEARLRRAQQQARLAYWSWQFASETTAEEFRWSPGSGQLLGMADADMPRNDVESMSITIPEDRERLGRLYDEVRAGLDNYAVEYRARRRDGAVVWVREIAEVVRDADGRRVGVEGTMQDITDQRALEDQLRQAQKMESIGQLTGGIAHDFNNLMAVILGNLELLAEDLPGNAAAQQKIATAIRSTLRGSDLTQRLLAFARQQSLAPKLTQIDDLIHSMRDLLLRPLGPAIAATFALGGGLWPTEIDQVRLETSLLNLVINARDAMPDGGKLTIATSNLAIEPGDARQVEGPAPGDYVLIAVADSGEGMTEEVRARAFDPFFTTKGIGKGTGLGLSMVYGFVKQSGGHIELISEVGRGTTVKIYLPAAKGPVAAGAPALPQG